MQLRPPSLAKGLSPRQPSRRERSLAEMPRATETQNPSTSAEARRGALPLHRHTYGREISRIRPHISNGGNFHRRIKANGVTIDYRAYVLADGAVSVGTIFSGEILCELFQIGNGS